MEENLSDLTSVENIQEKSFEMPVENSVMAVNDYYDYRYYDQIISKEDTIIDNQQTMIYNQEQMHLTLKNIETGINVLCFVMVLSVVYTFVKSILKV